MKKTTLTTKLTLAVSIISTLVTLVSGLGFSFFYYVLSERDLQNFVTDQARAITSEQVVYSGGELLYRQSPKGESFSTRLRNQDLSAVVFDTQLNSIGTYGIYNTISPDNFAAAVSLPTVKEVFIDHLPRSGRMIAPGNRLYDTYTLPVLSSGNLVGLIQFAKETQVVSKILSLNLTLLALIMPIAALLNAIVVTLLLRRSLAPLNQLILHLKNTPPHLAPQKVPLTNLTNDEISDLLNTFNQLLDQVGESINKQRDFIAHASHELKTPITGAVSSLDLALSTSPANSPSLRYVSQVKHNLMSLNRTLEGLLTMSRLSQNASSPNGPSYPVKAYLDTLIAPFADTIAQKHINFTFSCPDKLKTGLPKEHLQIITTNLLDNALKYTPNGGSVSLILTPVRSRIRMEIKDTGPGIPPADLDRIFDRFYRGRTASHVPGSGLGLSLVKLVCDLHRLQISVASEIGSGSTFTLHIPRS